MTRKHFERLVARAVAAFRALPPEMDNVAVVVEARPSADLLEEMEIEPPDTLYGPTRAFRCRNGMDPGNMLPDRITIFQQPIPRGLRARGRTSSKAIGETCPRFGHYFGLSEDEIEEIEER